MKNNKPRLTILAMAVYIITPVVLTTIGWRQVMLYKHPSHVNLAVWLPFIVLLNVHGVSAIAVSLLQFPLLAAMFFLAAKRWNQRFVIVLLLTVYAASCIIAWTMLNQGQWI